MSIIQRVRAGIYDTAIIQMTVPWYAAVLQRVAPGSHLLDVGVGTGKALLANRDLLVERDLRVTGVDIDEAYVRACREAVHQAGMEERIDVRLESIYDHGDGPYDAVYFSASFMLLPDPVAALHHVSGQLAEKARIYFTQTFEHRRSPAVERIKPMLRWLTTVDFGTVTYERDFEQILSAAGMQIIERAELSPGKKRAGVLIVAEPK